MGTGTIPFWWNEYSKVIVMISVLEQSYHVEEGTGGCPWVGAWEVEAWAVAWTSLEAACFQGASLQYVQKNSTLMIDMTNFTIISWTSLEACFHEASLKVYSQTRSDQCTTD